MESPTPGADDMSEAAARTSAALLEHGTFVKAVARQLARDACAAEDLEQDAWLAALQGRLTPAADPRGWLARVLETKASNHRRAEQRRRRRELTAAGNRGETPGPGAGEVVERMELRQRVVAAVLELEEPYRTTVILRFDRELAPTAIARELGVPLSTVKTRLRRALEQLRERLDREAGGDGRRWLSSLLVLLDETDPAPSVAKPLVSGTAVIAGIAAVLFTALFVGWRINRGLDRAADEKPLNVAATAPGEPAGGEALELLEATESPDSRIALAAEEAREEKNEIVVRVVDALTREPVEGATLWFAATGELPDLAWEAISEVGQKRTSAADGTAVISLANESTWVLVRHGDRSAQEILEPTDLGPFELGIERTRSLRVEVVDAEGGPAADVEVGLRRAAQPGSWRSTSRKSDANGIAEFLRIDEILAETPPGTTWEIFPDVPLVAPPTVQVDPLAPLTEPVRLQLPPTGRILVRLDDQHGRPIDKSTLVFLHLLVDGESPGRCNLFVEKGLGTIPYVEPGRRFSLVVPRGSGLPPVRVEAAGPTEPGQTVTVTITIPDDATRFVGRLVDERGAPLAEREFEYQGGVPHRTYNISRARTDPDGDFDLALPLAEESHLISVVAPALPGAPVRSGVIEIPVELSPGPVEVGDVCLATPPLFVRGRVVDGLGRGVPFAGVEISRHRPLSKEDEALERQEDVRRVSSITITHEPIPFLGVEADESGCFELRFENDGARHTLRATTAERGTSRQLPFEPGDEEVVIELERPGAIVGSLVLPDGIPLGLVQVRLGIGRELSRERQGRKLPKIEASGHFRVRCVPPGVHSVEVRVGEILGPVARIEGVRVEAGKLNADPRLQAIDLSRAVRVFALEIVDEQDRPIAAGRIFLRALDDPEAGSRTIQFEHGSARFVTGAGSFRAEVQASGYGTEVVPDLPDRRRVVLRRGLPVRLVLPAELEVPPEPWAIALLLLPPSLADRAADLEQHPAQLEARGAIPCDLTEKERTLELTLPEAGRWAMRWSLRNMENRRGFLLAPTEFTVDEGSQRQTIELLPDSASWTRTLSRIR